MFVDRDSETGRNSIKRRMNSDFKFEKKETYKKAHARYHATYLREAIKLDENLMGMSHKSNMRNFMEDKFVSFYLYHLSGYKKLSLLHSANYIVSIEGRILWNVFLSTTSFTRRLQFYFI